MTKRLTAALLAATPAAPAAAQQAIVVTGQALPEPEGAEALATTTVPRDALVTDPSGQLENALRDTPGFQLFRRSDARSANPTSQGATLRGIGGNAASRALVTLDGVPQGDPFGSWIPWPAIRPESLALVRVTPGGVAGAFGEGALTGAIELVSAGPDLRGSHAHARYGSRDSIDLSAGVAADLGEGFATVDGYFAEGDGFFTTAPEDRGAVDTRSPYEQRSVAVRAAFPALGGELQARMALFEDERQRGQRLVTSGNDGADFSLRYVGRGALPVEALAYVHTRSYRATFARTAPDRSTEQPALDQFNTPATGVGAKVELRPEFGGADTRIGADWRHADGETNERFDFDGRILTDTREAGGTSDVYGVFAGADVPLTQRLLLTASARLDRYELTDGFRSVRDGDADPPEESLVRFEDRDGWEPSGRLGIAYDSGAITYRAAAYSGWRLPTLNELYRPFRVGPDATAANEALEPERSYGAEAGADYEPLSTVRLGITGYVMRVEDAVANVTLAEGPGVFPGVGFVFGSFRQRLNLDAIEAYGVETSARVGLGPIYLAGSYAFTESEVEGSGATAAQDGFRPPQVPRHSASVSASYDLAENASVGASLRYVSEQFEDDLEQRPLDGFLLVDAHAQLPLGGGFALTGAAENLFDERVEDGIDVRGATTLAQPQTFWVGVRWSG